MTTLTRDIKDMFAHRDGRLKSKVIQLWQKKYKKIFLEEAVIISDNSAKKTLSEDDKMNHVWNDTHKNIIFEEGTILCHRYNYDHVPKDMLMIVRQDEEASEIAVDLLISWLNSPTGRTFISKAFDTNKIIISTDKAFSNYMIINDYKKTRGIDSNSAIEKFRTKTLAVEIAIDTLIGWLNSHVGRCFLCESFAIEIPRHATDGTD